MDGLALVGQRCGRGAGRRGRAPLAAAPGQPKNAARGAYVRGLGSLLYVGTPYVGVALVGQIALGVAWGVVNPLHNTIVQTTAPLEQLGRVNSVMGFGNMFAGVAPLAIAPWLAATFGVQQTLVGAGMIVTAVPAALLLFGHRHFDRAARQ